MAVDLGRAHRTAGHDSFIYCVFRGGPFADQAQKDGIRVSVFEKPLGLSLNAIWRIARQLKRDRIDVVHTHNAVIHHYGMAAARLAGVPVMINTRHGLALVPPAPKQERIFRACLPFTNAVVLVSEDAREFFIQQRKIPREKTRVILNGIPLANFERMQAQPGSVPGRIRFGTIGRMAAAKDHATLLRAFAIVAKQLPGAELTFLGDGPLWEETQALAGSLGIADRVRFPGAGTAVAEFLADLDVFAFSSVTEGLPMVILEAMAAGLPIVSTRVGGVPEVAPEGDVAWYAPIGDNVTLARLMVEAAQSGKLPAMGAKARRIALARYGIEHTQKQYEALFAEVWRGRVDTAGVQVSS